MAAEEWIGVCRTRRNTAIPGMTPKVYGPLAPDTEPAIEALSCEQAQRSIGWAEEKALGLKPKQFVKITPGPTGGWLYIHDEPAAPHNGR